MALPFSAQTYLSICKFVHDGAKRSPEQLAKHGQSPQSMWALWGWLTNARILEFKTEDYVEIYHAVDVYTTEVLAGVDWQPPNYGVDVPVEESRHHAGTIIRLGKDLPYPDRLPFEFTYVGFTSGIRLTHDQLILRSKSVTDIDQGALLGYLLTHQGDVFEFIAITNVDGERMGMIIEQQRTHVRWTNPYTLVPWILNSFINAVNEHRHFVEEHTPSFSYKREFDKIKRTLHAKFFVPRPYYTVNIARTIYTKEYERPSTGTRQGYSHRFDVRRHDRVRIRRGALPIEPATLRDLQRRRYKVCLEGEVDEAVAELLNKRHIPLRREGEWLAVLVTEVAECVKGPADAPYVPAIRKVNVLSEPVLLPPDDTKE